MKVFFYAAAVVCGLAIMGVTARMSNTLYGKIGWMCFALGVYGLLIYALVRGH